MAKTLKLKAAERRAIGRELYPLSVAFWDSIPLDRVDTVLRSHGYLLLQEDNTAWSGLLCGREANTTFTIGKLDTRDDNGVYEPIKDTLYFYWYKHETGRYEINMYLC